MGGIRLVGLGAGAGVGGDGGGPVRQQGPGLGMEAVIQVGFQAAQPVYLGAVGLFAEHRSNGADLL